MKNIIIKNQIYVYFDWEKKKDKLKKRKKSDKFINLWLVSKYTRMKNKRRKRKKKKKRKKL